MKDRKIDISVNDDPAPVNLDEPNMVHLEKWVQEMVLILSQIDGKVGDGTLTEGYKNTLLDLLQGKVADMCKLLDFESFLADEQEKRYSEVRELNEENRELRKQLGEKVSLEDVREKSRSVIREWRDYLRGFGFHAKDVALYEYGMQSSIAPIAVNQSLASNLRVFGIKTIGGPNERLLEIDASPESVNALKAYIGRFFPSIDFVGIATHIDDQGNFHVLDIQVIIRDLNDFKTEQN